MSIPKTCILNNDVINKLDNKTHNRYESIQIINYVCRMILDKYNNSILHSEVLNWVCNGIVPKIINLPIKERYDTISEVLDRELELVTNKWVYYSVRETIQISDKLQYLSYKYNKHIQKEDKPRVRILSNIIWDIINLDYTEDIKFECHNRRT